MSTIISNTMLRLLERLAEMFPKQTYQHRLDQYIAARHPQSVADVEHFVKEYDRRIAKEVW